ncbi:MAG: hypothetical protein K2L80_10255, partial [Muribaculaceae bacterium]|nr:hypothetical protein [Muribaculaceae bacterium]
AASYWYKRQDLHIASLASDGQILQLARMAAESVIDADPQLCSPLHRDMVFYMTRIAGRNADWSKIS